MFTNSVKISSFESSFSSESARKTSRSLRRSCFSFVMSVVRTSCWVSVLPPCEASIVVAATTDGARDALPVDARVLEEAVVLGGEHRLHDDRRNLLPGHGHAPLLADLREQLAVAAEDAQRHLQADVAQHGDVGQRRLQVVIGREECEPDQACDRNDDGGCDAQPSVQGRDHRERLCIVMSATAGAGVASPRRRDRDARHGRPSLSTCSIA